MPLFSIICPDFDGSVSQEHYERGIDCLRAQDFAEFEVLVIHDGPATQRRFGAEVEDPRFRFAASETRHNDFGHSLRDLGLRSASGDYIVHFNLDNLLYPHALAALAAAIRDGKPHLRHRSLVSEAPDILIFPIVMRGMTLIGDRLIRFKGREADLAIVLAGCPVRRHMIDCMQLVMRRQRWVEIGGWFDKSEDSDGRMYPQFVARFGAKYVPAVLGEHW